MNDRTSGELVSISETTQISFHQLQDIYNTLTGKFERISQSFDRAYLIKMEDLQQLHIRINQCCESYGARLKNESITVYHVGGAKETFSSFDRFKIYNKSNTSPVENVNIEYNILITPAGSAKVVPYRIRLNLISRAGLREKSPGMFIGSSSLLKFLGRPDGFVSIEYADYSAARHFLTQINEWYEALEFSSERAWLKKMQELSHWLRYIVPVSILCTTILGLGRVHAAKLNANVDASLITSITQITSVSIFAWLLAMIAGRSIEASIDRIQPISYVLLNRGDEKIKEKWKKSNITNLAIATTTTIGAISVNIMSSWIFEVVLKQ